MQDDTTTAPELILLPISPGTELHAQLVKLQALWARDPLLGWSANASALPAVARATFEYGVREQLEYAENRSRRYDPL
jgi:hypothetical protein